MTQRILLPGRESTESESNYSYKSLVNAMLKNVSTRGDSTLNVFAAIIWAIIALSNVCNIHARPRNC